ncbi:MAG: polysaccharide biosynthesis protein [Bacteroidota bacterium]
MIKKIFFTLLILIVSFIVFQLLNHLVIEKIIIGDPCEYDTEGNETGKLFNLFYTISSNTGYHPEPSLFNFYFTTILSTVIGLLVAYKRLWKPTGKRSTNA